MQTLKQMMARIKEQHVAKAAPKPSAPPPPGIAGSPPTSNSSASSYPSTAEKPVQYNKAQVEFMKKMHARAMEKKLEKEAENYNDNIITRKRKILQITDICKKKDGLQAIHNLANEYQTVEEAMDFYKGVVLPLYEFYQFLDITVNTIITYHMDGRSVDQIKASLDWMINHPNQQYIFPSEKSARRNPFARHRTSQSIVPYKPPHVAQRENLQSRWASIRQNMLGSETYTHIEPEPEPQRDMYGRLEDMSTLYDYRDSDSDSDSDGGYPSSSGDEWADNEDDDSNSIIRINADGSTERMRFNRPANGPPEYSHNMFGTTSPQNESMFGNLYEDEDELPSYDDSTPREETGYRDRRAIWNNFMENARKQHQENDGRSYQEDKRKFMEEYYKAYKSGNKRRHANL